MTKKPGDELVDIVDAEGNITTTVTRAEMRVNRLPHRCAYILVFDSAGRVFVHQRTATKDVYPSYWDVTVGGVLASGESFDDGAVREACEELGIDSLHLERLFPLQYADERSVVHGMVYRAEHDGPFRLQPEEIVHGEFVSVDEAEVRMQREAFCPDGLAVWRQFRG